MEAEIFANEIGKTGFVLENQVATILKADGWNTICNKYYIDDQAESVREIDIVAYRARDTKNFKVYTVLIISCKKNDANVWALLSRDINLNDPNANWYPLHVWSNDKAIQYLLSQDLLAAEYHEKGKKTGAESALSTPKVEVFAFQEMDKKSGKPHNDKSIFAAITSLVKAQAYEISALPARKKTPVVYQFNLLSIVDSDLVRLNFKGDSITQTTIEDEHFLSRYIVNREETFSRIRFIQSNFFTAILRDYKKLHAHNCTYFKNVNDSFFVNIFQSKSKTDIYLDDFKREIGWFISYRVEQNFGFSFDFDKKDISFQYTDNSLQISVDCNSDIIAFFNASDRILARTQEALVKFYRYSGEFTFDEDYIPF